MILITTSMQTVNDKRKCHGDVAGATELGIFLVHSIFSMTAMEENTNYSTEDYSWWRSRNMLSK